MLCSYCERDMQDGMRDAAGSFWCLECIEAEGMQVCAGCNRIYPAGDMAGGSAPGRLCMTCHWRH